MFTDIVLELGQASLIIASLMAWCQGLCLPFFLKRGLGFAFVGRFRSGQRFLKLSAFWQLSFLALGFICLIISFVLSDFRLEIVYQNSHTLKPLFYKITAVWGNHEGSLYLWVLVLALFGGAMSLEKRGRKSILALFALSVQGIIGGMFLCMLLFTSNPFALATMSASEGLGLNPLLQDVGLSLHPPILYVGYVGFSTVFSLAIAGLVTVRIGKEWTQMLRFYTLLAWSFLTAGIVLGSWWAYYELGWGGFWFWDPVENVSLLPWFAGTALLHCLRAGYHHLLFRKWMVVLALACFCASMFGTFLVRSGIITSVHAFASSPQRGIVILLILFLTMACSLVLYYLLINKAFRHREQTGQLDWHWCSREGLLLLNNYLLSGMLLIVLTGTLYPLFFTMVTGQEISVGEDYFNGSLYPLFLLVAIFLPLACWFAYPQLSHRNRRLYMGVICGSISLFIAYILYLLPLSLAQLTMLIGGIWIIVGSLGELFLKGFKLQNIVLMVRNLSWQGMGRILAHTGLGIGMIGMVGTACFKQEFIANLHPNQPQNWQGYVVTLQDYELKQQDNYWSERLTVKLHEVVTGKQHIFYPERRFYPNAGRVTTEADIRLFYWGDFYVTSGARQKDGAYLIRIWQHPFVGGLWLGGGLMALGGFLLIWGGRRFYRQKP